MTPRGLGIAAACLAVLAVVSIAWVDVPLARRIAGLPEGVRGFFDAGTGGLDILTAKKLADWGLPLALLLVALCARVRPARRPFARLLVLVALSNALSHWIVGLLKPAFGRLRPHQIAELDWIDRFFDGGSSFPSGHTAFYLGLSLPLAWALPRWRLPLLVPALFIAVARVLVNDHFAGDVLGASAITAAVCAGLIAAFERGIRPVQPIRAR